MLVIFVCDISITIKQSRTIINKTKTMKRLKRERQRGVKKKKKTKFQGVDP